MARSMLRQSRYITSSAMDEAAELGHPEADVDHLLLGLLATGGPSSSVLVAAGVDLHTARRAVRELQQVELGEFALPVPPARPVKNSVYVPLSPRALEVMKRVDHSADDLALLHELVADGGRVDRLLQHLDVDPGKLRTPVDVTSNPSDALATVTVDVPASAQAVWDVLTDDRHNPAWEDSEGVSVDEDGVVHLRFSKGKRSWTCDHRTVERHEGHEIVWHRFLVGRRPVDVRLRAVLEDRGAGCRLRLELRAGTSRFVRYLRPLARAMARSQLRFRAQEIARAASRRPTQPTPE